MAYHVQYQSAFQSSIGTLHPSSILCTPTCKWSNKVSKERSALCYIYFRRGSLAHPSTLDIRWEPISWLIQVCIGCLARLQLLTDYLCWHGWHVKVMSKKANKQLRQIQRSSEYDKDDNHPKYIRNGKPATKTKADLTLAQQETTGSGSNLILTTSGPYHHHTFEPRAREQTEYGNLERQFIS